MSRYSWPARGLFTMMIPLVAIACSGGDKSDDGSDDGAGDDGGDGTDGGGDGPGIEEFINVTTSPVGDLTGFEAGYDEATGWWVQTPDPAKQVEVPLTGSATDFETGDGVPDAKVEIWNNDVVSGVANIEFTSDSSGNVSGTSIVCQPQTYKVTTDPDLAETKETYEAHQMYGFAESLDGEDFNSVSTTTYSIIPSLLGVSPDTDKGIVAGTCFDVNEDPIEGAQVVIVDAEGNIPESLVVKYFVDEFPNRNQPNTSPDGLWVAVNIPAGEWFAQMWVSDGAGGHKLLGASTLTVFADSINIGNIYTGYGDGVKYPESCL
jgi:hypothetical protein